MYSPKNPLFPTNTNVDEDEDEMLKHFNNLKSLINATTKNLSGYDFDIGIHYNWNHSTYQNKTPTTIPHKDWLNSVIDNEFDLHNNKESFDNLYAKIKSLNGNDDQEMLVIMVLLKLR